MKGKYYSAFLIPRNAKKLLTEFGWEFTTPNRLSEELVKHLVNALDLELRESYLEIDSYVSSRFKMSVVRDKENRVENIHFQLLGDLGCELSNALQGFKNGGEADLFFPNTQASSEY